MKTDLWDDKSFLPKILNIFINYPFLIPDINCFKSQFKNRVGKVDAIDQGFPLLNRVDQNIRTVYVAQRSQITHG